MATPVSYHIARGPGAGLLLRSFRCASDANAQAVAQSYATLFGTTVYLTRIDTNAPLGSYTPQSGVPAWTASAPRALGAFVQPTVANGFLYTCTTAGTSAASQPTWPTTIGATIADGGAVWTNVGPLPAPTGSPTWSPY